MCEVTRQYDADMGEVTTQDPDGTVLSVEGCSPPAAPAWQFTADGLQLGLLTKGPCVRVTRFIRDHAITATFYADGEANGRGVQMFSLPEAIALAEAWWARQGGAS